MELVFPTFTQEQGIFKKKQGRSLYWETYIAPPLFLCAKNIYPETIDLQKNLLQYFKKYFLITYKTWENSEEKTSLFYEYFFDDIYWDLEEYICTYHEIYHRYYVTFLHVADKTLQDTALLIIKHIYGDGTLLGDQLTLSLLLKNFPNLTLEDLFQTFGRFLYHVIHNRDLFIKKPEISL